MIGRLYVREYFAVIFGCLFIGFEALLRFAIFFLPRPVIRWFHDRTRQIFNHYFVTRGNSSTTFVSNEEQRLADKIRVALDFEELCDIFGYQHEEHVVQTKDGYLLGIHRIPCRKGERNLNSGMSPGKNVHKPVVYLHHGLLMCSDVFLCTTSAHRSLPLMLAEAGYDVWLGNNRGNKYSKKHVTHHPYSSHFWYVSCLVSNSEFVHLFSISYRNFCIDEFARYDIPDSIEYILKVTGEKSLSYIGFSQGTAQAFAALSICPTLNTKVDVFVALAPAMSPPGLSAPIVDGLMKASYDFPSP